MEYTALYRRWRPTIFDELVGQEAIVRILKNQIKGNRIAHAYLFCGPRGTGKTSTAKIFSRAVNCLEPVDGSPCDKCDVCTGFISGNIMDIIEIDAASNNGVNEIRDLRDKVKFPPTLGRYKVYIIDEVHMLSMGAFNALLKTLEEPPSHIIFILATTEPHKLPATILSRCQRYDFKRIPNNVIANRLGDIAVKSDIEIEEEALYTIARWAEGGMRDALSLLDQCIGFCGNTVTESDVLSILGTADQGFMFSMIDSIIKSDISHLMVSIDRLIEDGKDIAVFLKDLIYHLRNLLIVKTCSNYEKLLDVSQGTLKRYNEQAKEVGVERVIRSIEMLNELEANLKWSSQPRVLVELAMVRICRPEQENSYDALLDRLDNLEKYIATLKTKGVIIDTTNTGKANEIQSEEPPAEQNENQLGKKPKDGPENIRVEKTARAQRTKAKPGKQDDELTSEDKSILQPAVKKPAQDIVKVWPNVLKEVKKERVAIYSLLGSAKIKPKGEGRATLLFPPDQGFFVAAIDKEENKKFIEEMIYKVSGESIKIRCKLDDGDQKEESEEDDIVKKAIDLFGAENVEVVEEDMEP